MTFNYKNTSEINNANSFIGIYEISKLNEIKNKKIENEKKKIIIAFFF